MDNRTNRCRDGRHPYADPVLKGECFSRCSCWCHYFVETAEEHRRSEGGYEYWDHLDITVMRVLNEVLLALDLKRKGVKQP